jgi:hypothetical protein
MNIRSWQTKCALKHTVLRSYHIIRIHSRKFYTDISQECVRKWKLREFSTSCHSLIWLDFEFFVLTTINVLCMHACIIHVHNIREGRVSHALRCRPSLAQVHQVLIHKRETTRASTSTNWYMYTTRTQHFVAVHVQNREECHQHYSGTA